MNRAYPHSSIPIGMERGYTAGLLVAEAKVKGFEKPWSILIDSGASCNYARLRSIEEVSVMLKRLQRMRVIQSRFV